MPITKTEENALTKTTIIPLDDNKVALTMYNELIGSDKIIMVILGDSETIQDGVKLANKRARQITTNEKLWVMWIGNHEVLKDKLHPILEKAEIIQGKDAYEEVKAFCLTKKPRKANSRVHLNGELSFFSIDKLFREAIANI